MFRHVFCLTRSRCFSKWQLIVRTEGIAPFSFVNMSGSRIDTTPDSKKGWNLKMLAIGLLLLAGIAVFGLVSCSNRSKEAKIQPAMQQAEIPYAELLSSTGAVLVRKPGKVEWHEAKTGVRLAEGDLIQTDQAGEATIRYSSGTTITIQAKTVFTVQPSGNGQMEISAPPLDALPINKTQGAGGFPAANANESQPSIELQRIIPFGRSLELIGRVEAGSSLMVNDESIEVAGDGSFKHFTNPFPASAGNVNLVMKVTDLSGRTRVLTATHDFSPHSRGK